MIILTVYLFRLTGTAKDWTIDPAPYDKCVAFLCYRNGRHNNFCWFCRIRDEYTNSEVQAAQDKDARYHYSYNTFQAAF